jgi:competence protein ComGC
MRTRGFTVFELLVILALMAVLGAIMVPLALRNRKNRMEADAISALKTFATSEAVFREGDKENDGNLDYGMLSELGSCRLIDEEFASGTKNGYLFQGSYSFSTSEFLWFAVANPVMPGATGDRYFSSNMAGVIFYTTAAAELVDTNSCLLPRNPILPTR